MSNEWVTPARLGAIELIRLVGEIDLVNAEEIGAEIGRHTETSAAVLIDLSGVSFIDSAGVRLLDAIVADLDRRGTPVRLVVPAGTPVRMVMTLCAFRDDLVDTELSAATAALGG